MVRLRHLMTLRGTIAVPAALAFARFKNRAKEGLIVHEDSSLWIIHVEGKWWYHGEYRFSPHPSGCEVKLDVFSKLHGIPRLFAVIPTMQAKRRLRRTWQQALREMGT